jgi:PAS domain-containing protein
LTFWFLSGFTESIGNIFRATPRILAPGQWVKAATSGVYGRTTRSFQWRSASSPLESAEGILVTAANRDISVRRKAERRLGQMESRYRGLLEAAPDAMVMNQSGEIALLNVQAENSSDTAAMNWSDKR